MPKITHLYNSAGVWIAVRRDDVVYDTEGKWIGWIPWNDEEVVDTDGYYLGTIVDGSRLFRNSFHEERDYPGYPGRPAPMSEAGYPGFGGSVALPPDMTDVTL
jgi:hypothetical protein